MACFPDSVLIPGLGAANRGIASTNLRELAHYLFTMARVMASWGSVNKEGWIVKSYWGWRRKSIYATLNHSFAASRRAAILPRCLSSATISPSASSPHLQLAPLVLELNHSIPINPFVPTSPN
jgi:hypothetical protein